MGKLKRYEPIYESVNIYDGYAGRMIIDTKHSIDRYSDRYNNILNKDTVNQVIQNVIKEILSDYNDTEGQYGFHSKSTGIGGIITWRRQGDPKLDDGNNHAVITTLFPIKKFHTFRNVDAELIVEQQVTLWAEEQGYKKEFKESLCESYGEDHKFYKDDFFVSFFEGKLYDFYLDGYVLVQ